MLTTVESAADAVFGSADTDTRADAVKEAAAVGGGDVVCTTTGVVEGGT